MRVPVSRMFVAKVWRVSDTNTRRNTRLLRLLLVLLLTAGLGQAALVLSVDIVTPVQTFASEPAGQRDTLNATLLPFASTLTLPASLDLIQVTFTQNCQTCGDTEYFTAGTLANVSVANTATGETRTTPLYYNLIGVQYSNNVPVYIAFSSSVETGIFRFSDGTGVLLQPRLPNPGGSPTLARNYGLTFSAINAVPEPSTTSLIASGVAMLYFVRRLLPTGRG